MKFFTLFFGFLNDIYQNKFLITQLTKRDFSNKYIGSTLGFVWTIIQPFVMIGVMWLVFTKGFKAGPVDGIPFIAWLTCGIIVWDFFANTISSATNVFSEYNYLVKKISFRIAILPIVKILSALIAHFILIGIAMVIFIGSGVEFSVYWFQMFYYMFALFIFLLGLSWITSSLQVFLKDISQIVQVFLQFGFWLTPIMWSYKMIPENFMWALKINPIFYIVNGYRQSFLTPTPFWQDLTSLAYFWGGTLVVVLVGVLLFRKLRPHFADVL